MESSEASARPSRPSRPSRPPSPPSPLPALRRPPALEQPLPEFWLLGSVASSDWHQLRRLLATDAHCSREYRRHCLHKRSVECRRGDVKYRRFKEAFSQKQLRRLEQQRPSAFECGDDVVLWHHDQCSAVVGRVEEVLPHQHKLRICIPNHNNGEPAEVSDIAARNEGVEEGDHKRKLEDDCLGEMAEILRWIDRKATLLAQLKVMNEFAANDAAPASTPEAAAFKADYAWIVLELQRTNDVLDHKLQQCRVLVSSGKRARTEVSDAAASPDGDARPPPLNTAELMQRCRQDAAALIDRVAKDASAELASPEILHYMGHCVSFVLLMQQCVWSGSYPADALSMALRGLRPRSHENLDRFDSVQHCVDQLHGVIYSAETASAASPTSM